MTPSHEALLREFPDRGALYLLDNPDHLRALLRIVARDLADTLDFTRLERVETTLIPEDLRKREADLLFRIPFRDAEGEREVWIYLLLEHQSTSDPTMPLRLLGYLVRLWERQLREATASPPLSPIVPLVFYTGSGRWETVFDLSEMMRLPERLREFIPRWRTLFLPLKQTAAETLTAEGGVLGWILRVWQAEESGTSEFAAVLETAMRFIGTLTAEELRAWTEAVIILLALIEHRRQPEERDDLWSIMRRAATERQRAQEVESTMRTIADMHREEGLAEGQLRAKREVLLRLLELKFGELPPEVGAQVEAMSDQERLSDLIAQVLTAPTLADMDLS